MDTKLLKKHIAKQVAEFFNLDIEAVIWQKDLHYQT